MANQIKQLTSLLFLCIIVTAAVIPPWAEAQVTCKDVITDFLPCANYVMNGGKVPPELCCGALRTIMKLLETKQDTQSACECMKDLAARLFSQDQEKRAQTIPPYCDIPFPFQIGRNVDCSAVQ